MKKTLIALVMLMVSMVGCGSQNGSSSGISPSASDVYYLASNIIMNKANAAGLTAATKNIDTTTTISADHVILDNAGLSLQAPTVQSAFDQTLPDMTQYILGTWGVQSVSIGYISTYDNATHQVIPGKPAPTLNDLNPIVDDGETVTFNSDGTFSTTIQPNNSTKNQSDKSIFRSWIQQAYGNPDVRNNVKFGYQIVNNSILILKATYDEHPLCLAPVGVGNCTTSNANYSSSGNSTNDLCICGGLTTYANVTCPQYCGDTSYLAQSNPNYPPSNGQAPVVSSVESTIVPISKVAGNTVTLELATLTKLQ